MNESPVGWYGGQWLGGVFEWPLFVDGRLWQDHRRIGSATDTSRPGFWSSYTMLARFLGDSSQISVV
jgi:hypothetical protein